MGDVIALYFRFDSRQGEGKIEIPASGRYGPQF